MPPCPSLYKAAPHAVRRGVTALLTWLALLGTSPTLQADETIRLDVPIYAASLVGTPYHWGGTAPGEGFDCSGLVTHVFSQVAGIRLPRGSRALADHATEIERSELEPGDLVFFDTRDAPYSHVGIYLGEARFVHASSTQTGTIVLSNLEDTYWRERFAGARRVRVQP